STYHAMQWRLDRRFAHGFQLNASNTWSKNLDSTSEGIAAINLQGIGTNRSSLPPSLGGLKLDHGPSDYDRAQRFTLLYVWDIPSPAQALWKRALGGWSLAGITSFQSGAPFSVLNGIARSNIAGAGRPDISNPSAPLNTRAAVTPASGSQFCGTGYRNPDTGLCVSPAEGRWIQGVGLPEDSTVGRNTLVASGINNFDVTLTKSLQITEGRRLEFRWEALNAFNHPQFTQIPSMSVTGTPAGRFLNRDYTDSGIRSMWAQVKFVF